jgi:hypothetical protein
MTWTLAKGHKGPVKGLRASGPQGLDPLFTTTTYCRPIHNAYSFTKINYNDNNNTNRYVKL